MIWKDIFGKNEKRQQQINAKTIPLKTFSGSTNILLLISSIAEQMRFTKTQNLS
jgi:hypothetical protein